MNWLITRLLRLWFASLVAILGWPVAYAVAQPLPVCGWPFESNGRGITNVATPDTNATYWVMPFDTGSWAAMVIQGRYPKARFFNFDTYTSNGAAVDTIIDSNITPDPGSTNPFAALSASLPQNYSVVISHGPTGSANSLRVGGSRLAFVVFRVYLPDMGIDKTGGFGLPLVSLIAPNGSVRRLQPCPFADAETSATSLIAQLAQNGFIEAANFLAQILLATNQTSSVTCNPAQPGPASVSFAPATLGTNFFTNPQTTYLETPGFCFHQDKVLVVRGKALVFPNTYLHGRCPSRPSIQGSRPATGRCATTTGSSRIRHRLPGRLRDPSRPEPVLHVSHLQRSGPAILASCRSDLAAVGHRQRPKELDTQDHSSREPRARRRRLHTPRSVLRPRGSRPERLAGLFCRGRNHVRHGIWP